MTFPTRRAVLATTAAALAAGPALADPATPLTRLCFGSCARETKDQPIWNAILAKQPELFVFLGDNIYADTTDPEVMARKYAALAAKPGFQKLKASTPIRAMWDDHDYGANDSGADYAMKDEARRQFCDFWSEAPDSPRRTQEGGVYAAYLFGPPGQRVQLILPDLRWNKTPVTPPGGFFAVATKYLAAKITGRGARGAYRPVVDPAATMLGAAQWAWLERQFQEPADLRIIGSSLQALSRGTGWEAWDLFPHEQQRLEALIGQAGNVVLLSGDVHYAELTRAERPGAPPLWELTSSGLTEVWPNLPPNDRRVATYRGRNFGLVEIDWAARSVALSACDEQGAVKLSQAVGFG
jgi:alkaline phosphatase D